MSRAAYDDLLATARADPNIVGFWLGGSRGKGRETPHSDWDVGLVVRDEAFDAYRARYARLGGGLDVLVFTLAGLEAYAAWGGPQAWDRYSFADVRALVDKTGQVQPLIDAKSVIPPDDVGAFVAARLDHAVNQAYRAAKCRRDGARLAMRWEAAEAVAPILDVLFALDGGRLRPYPKYLAWELERAPWPADALLALLDGVLSPDPVPALVALLRGLEPAARDAGHGGVLDAWGDAWPWLMGLG